MSGFTEQQRAWKQEIKQATPETVFSGTAREIVVSPAEQVRYKEHAKFGEMLVDDLLWATSQDQGLEEASIKQRFQALLDRGLTEDQRKRLVFIQDVLLRQYTITKRVGRKELLRRVESAADRISGGLVEFLPSRINPEDIEVTPFGAIIITIRDRHMWEEELEFPENTRGKTIQIDEEVLAVLPFRERETIERVILLRATDDGPLQFAVRRHELFHDLHKHAFNPVMKVEYENSEQAICFRGLRNELTAYAISQEWQLKLSALLNWKKQVGNKAIRERIASLVEKEWVSKGMTESEARAQAKTFISEIQALEYHLCRLALSDSKAFAPLMHVVITAESVKELVYHLSHIPSDPIDAVKAAIKQPSGEPIFPRALDLIRWASAKSLPVLHLDQLVESIHLKLDEERAKNASSKAVQNWNQLLEDIAANRQKMEA